MRKLYLFLFLVSFLHLTVSSQNALGFPNSIASYASVPDNAALNLSANQSFTVTTWVKTASLANQLLICKRLNGAGAGYELWQLNGYLAVNCTHTNGTSSGLPGGSKYKINDDKWHHLAFEVDIATNAYYLYVDGKLEVTKALTSTSGITNAQALLMGVRSGTPFTMPLSGALDEIRIYNKALTSAELIADMSEVVTSTTSNLLAAWNCNEGSGSTLTDIKSTNPATITGTVTWPVTSVLSPQAITFAGPINLALGSADISPATSSSPMSILYTTTEPAVASIVNGKIHAVAKGNCTITANQLANLFYSAAPSVSQTLNVTKTAITFNLPYTDHAVIQRDKPIVVYGTADKNDVLTITLDGIVQNATVDATGKWSCIFPAKEAKSTAFTLSAEGLNSQLTTLTDLLCGDVWVAAGQSNMLMPIGPGYSLGGVNNYSAVIAAANYPNIRFIQPVDLWQQATTPQTALLTASNGWTVCSPSTASGYSAVAYFFAKQIHLDQSVPVGIIQAAVGGTRIEAWTPLEGLQSIPEYASFYTKATTTTMETGQTYNRKNFPTVNYNGMMAPFTHNPIKGIIWYQGEENLGMDTPALNYSNKFKASIQSWRNAWSDQNLPVYYTELANYSWSTWKNGSLTIPSREHHPKFIVEMRKTTALPNVNGVTISDVSNYTDIHPKDKAPVGIRLGNLALAQTYGKNIVPTAATFKEMRSDGSALRITFNNNTGFKLKTGSSINEFKIAGADKVFKTAIAVLSGNDVLVSEPTILRPLYVNFAWDENSNPNLFNGSDSPTSRFSDSLMVNTINFTAIQVPLTTASDDIELIATASSGLSVVFSSSNTDVAQIVNGKLHIVGEGSTTITASENGNTIFGAASMISQTISVSGLSDVSYIVSQALTIFPNPAKESVTIHPVATGDTIQLLNTAGKVISSMLAMSNKTELNLSKISSGTYFISVKSDEATKFVKFNVAK